MTTQGVVGNVTQARLGDELVVGAAAGDLVLFLDDVVELDETGGTVRVGAADRAAQIAAYSSVDDDAGTVTLAVPLAAAWPAGTRVDVWDTATNAAAVEWRAQVYPAGDLDADDALEAVVSHALVPLLPEGVRDPGAGEVVTLEEDGSGWLVTNVRGRVPQIDGARIAPGTVPKESLSFQAGGVNATFAPAAPDAPTLGDLWFDTAHGNKLNRWDGAAWQPYAFGTDALADRSISAGKVNFTAPDIGGGPTVTMAAAAPATPREGDLWYDAANGYRLSVYTAGAWVVRRLGTGAIDAGSITADLIAGGTITATQLAAGAVIAEKIAAGAITADKLHAGVIDANAIVAEALAVGTLNAATISTLSLSAGTISGTSIGSSTIDSTALSACDFVIEEDAGRILVYDMGSVQSATLSASGNWTVPAGVTSVKVECWGGGAGGDGGYNPDATYGTPVYAAYSGGGGEYAQETVTVTPGAVIPVTVGAGGTGGNATGVPPGAYGTAGGSTIFGSNLVVAHGGSSHAGKGAGGTGSTNRTHYSGGSGVTNGDASSSTTTINGHGGGSSAGTTAVGKPGTKGNDNVRAAAGGVAPTGGGNGGAGGYFWTTSDQSPGGKVGVVPGGGGGSGVNEALPGDTGGAGARGQIKVTYTLARKLIASVAGNAGTDPYGNAYEQGITLADSGVITSGIATSAGSGTITGQSFRKIGKQVIWYVTGTLSAAIATNANGDITNTQLAQFAAGWRPGSTVIGQSGATGPTWHGAVGTDGSMTVAAVPPNQAYGIGQGWSMGGTFFVP